MRRRTSYSERSYSSSTLTANGLVEEIRSRCTGSFRIRSLEAVLPLITRDGHFSSSTDRFPQFILSTWADELAPHEVYPRCPEICRQLVEEHVSTPGGNVPGLDLATLFLAAGGQTDGALQGLSLLIAPPAKPRSSLEPAPPSLEDLLQQWLPEDMAAWEQRRPLAFRRGGKGAGMGGRPQAVDCRRGEDPLAGGGAPAPEPLR